MIRSNQPKGFAIVLAWPQTYCKQTGSWYDVLLLKLGINKNHYYRVGHAAIVLIDAKTNECHYFDFGRYHAPYQHGRARSAETDYDLKLKTKAVLSSNKDELKNYVEILKELQSHAAFHGDGTLEASIGEVNFESAHKKAKQMQQRVFIPYGPFRYKGSNCSRFVSTVLNAGEISVKAWFKLNFLISLTPTPMSNVNAFPNRYSQEKLYQEIAYFPMKKLSLEQLESTILAPEKPERIPTNAQWLSGEGCGSWFSVSHENKYLRVTRYSPQGDEEFSGIFENEKHHSTIFQHSNITYPSNWKVVNLRYDQQDVPFYRIDS